MPVIATDHLPEKREKWVSDLDKEYLIFISHDSKDSDLALELYDMLVEMKPEWEDQIFLDRSNARPLDSSAEWNPTMLDAVQNARHLIFVTRDLMYVKDGGGWLYREARLFHSRHVDRIKEKRPDKNVSYFGIFFCPCDLKNDLFGDWEKGSTYKDMYEEAQHHVMQPGQSLQDIKGMLCDKVLRMVEGRSDDAFSRGLLKETEAYLEKQVQRGVMLAETAIDEKLLPPLKKLSEDAGEGGQSPNGRKIPNGQAADPQEESETEEDEKKLGFDLLAEMVQENHVQIIGREGGSGKTTLMTKLFYHQLKLCRQDKDHNMIPLFVDAKALAAKNTLIRRYLAYTLLGDRDAMNEDNISPGAKALDTVFSIKRDKPRYLLLIDGYNELPERSVKSLNEELQDFLPGGCYENVRVVMSGRVADGVLPESAFHQIEVQALEEKTVYGYLNKKVSGSLLRILKNPMYLKLYTDTGIHSDIHTRGDLLSAFLDWQESKDASAAKDAAETAMRHILLRHVLPAVVYRMMTDNKDDSTFVLTKRALVMMFKPIQERISDTLYWMHYPDSYSDALSQAAFEEQSDRNLYNAFVKYLVDDCRLLHQDSNGNFEFIHQNYRDFFCAWYIAEDIRIQLDENRCSSALSAGIFDDDVTEFAADLLKESGPQYRWELGKWDYSCNENSCLVRTLEILRKNAPEDKICAANIIMMLRHARRRDLSGLNFSGLDLTEANLQICTFSHFDQTQTYPTNFSSATINRENLLTERHYNQLRTACTNQQYIACLDMGGILKLWEKTMHPKFPVKVLTDLRAAATKLLFSPDGTSLYAMTLHEIMEIPLPADFISKAKPKRLFYTPEQLRDMKLDDQGQLLFATYTNPFNYKLITDPNAEDKINIYRITSAAAVSNDGSCLACGTITGHDELVIYDKQADGTWQERKFGFAKILEDYIQDLKECFQSMGLYDYFVRNNQGEYVGETFFPLLRDAFMDRTHSYERLPAKVANSCKSYLRSRGVQLDPEQKEQLHDLLDAYTQRIKKALDKDGVLIHLCGRRITGLSFHEKNNTLLLSGTIDYKRKLDAKSEMDAEKGEPEQEGKKKKRLDEKTAFSNWVVTLNKDTLETRMLNMHRGGNPNRAFYCGDDIVVMTRYQVNVYDKNGAEVALLRPDIHRFRRFINIPGEDTCYVFSNGNIYQMDQELRCIRSIRNRLNESDLTYIVDEHGGEYLAKSQRDGIDTQANVIDLHSGEICKCPEEYSMVCQTGRQTGIGSMRFGIRGNNLVVYDNGVESAETAIHHSLHICDCDFRGVKGTLNNPTDLQTLHRMGANTDPVELSRVEFIADEEVFVPSDAKFGLQKGLSPAKYTYREGMVLKPDCKFNGDSGNKMAEQKTWEIIRSGTTTGEDLDAADYSILEWVDRLRYATPDMIHDLMVAGLIPSPRREQSAYSRITGKLHTTCKFLRQSRFFQADAGEDPPIATVNFPFGAEVLTSITGEEPEKQPVIKRERKWKWKRHAVDPQTMTVEDPEVLRDILRVLALNSWFCSTARRYRHCIEDHSLHSIFETNLYFDGRGKVNGYICLGDQPFFAEAVRDFDEESKNKRIFEETISKITRLSLLALYYRSVVSLGNQLLGLKRQPILVLICEDFEQCRKLNAHVQNIVPQVRKLYTIDSLFAEKKAGAGSYFEFCGDEPRFVRLEPLFR